MLNNKLLDLYRSAGFSTEVEGKWPNIYSVGKPMEELVRLVIEECAQAAENHSRSFSGVDVGAKGAADAVRNVGATLLK